MFLFKKFLKKKKLLILIVARILIPYNRNVQIISQGQPKDIVTSAGYPYDIFYCV